MAKISKMLQKLEEIVVLIAIFVTISAIFLNVLMRNIFQFPLSWPDEIGRYLLIFIIFFGYIIGIRRGVEIKLDIIRVIFPRFKKHFSILTSSASIIFSLILVILGFKYMLFKYMLETKSVILEIPVWIFICVFLVIGGGLMTYRYTERLIREYKEKKD